MSRSRRGSTSIEQLLTLTLLGITTAIVVLSGAPVLDAVAVEAASRETTTLFALARDHALATGTSVAVHIDPDRRRLVVHSARDTLAAADFTRTDIRLTATRDSMAYAASGLGSGAANLRLTLSRGRRSDTVTVSRLGRVSRL